MNHNQHRQEETRRATGLVECEVSWRREEQQTHHPVQQQQPEANGYVAYKADHVVPMAKDDNGFFEQFGADAEASVERNVETTGEFKFSNEVGRVGGVWRELLRRTMMWAYDDTNALLISRELQFAPFFLTGYEAYLMSELIKALDSGDSREMSMALSQAFQNRNIARLVVQALSSRYDFVWHLSTAITWNREFDLWSQVPLVGITGFPATENFPSTRDHALASIFRNVLGPGSWVTRLVTGREGLITDDPTAVAQNLAAESNGFELANRNQYGTYIGRNKTNAFRFEHRLPTDESILRTFVAQPMSTLVNNGVVHVLRHVAKHWENMLNQEWGNFSHQRMEQLDPFETLRFHMPAVLLVLSSLRGRNHEDKRVLGPTIRELQQLRPDMDDNETAIQLVERLLNMDFVMLVTGGIRSIAEPFCRWLNAIRRALTEITAEVRTIGTIIETVESGIRIGYDLLSKVDWTVPKDKELESEIVNLIQNINTTESSNVRTDRREARRALEMMMPRDKRTLIELYKEGSGNSKPAKLLLSRVATLLQREIRRESLCEAIRKASRGGEDVPPGDLAKDAWYWIIENGPDKDSVYFFSGEDREGPVLVHADSGCERTVSLEDIENGRLSFRRYIPVGESIVRVQKAFMNIELDHGRKFSYAAFMEFDHWRDRLRQLIAVSQMNCEELDDARLKLLREAQRSNKTKVEHQELVYGRTYHYQNEDTGKYHAFVFDGNIPGYNVVTVPPQSVIVVGGGPTGLLSTIHCTENCLVTGGNMKLYEDRDAFPKGGATFERAQVVRLDPRWVAMLRFHIGTAFEDVFIPASGETDAQLGNTLPDQGFVELTIKDLESMLHVQIAKLWSAGLISVFTKSKAQYDHDTDSLTKLGAHLKRDDVVRRYVDENGFASDVLQSWRVAEVISEKTITEVPAQSIGRDFSIYVQAEEQVLPFKLVAVDIENTSYTFKSLTPGVEDLTVDARRLPSIYAAGEMLDAHSNIRSVVLECVRRSEVGQSYLRHTVSMKLIGKVSFILDIGQTHVYEATGKAKTAKVHLTVTTDEPYGVCCLQGLKVSLGMHNFGAKRWGAGLLDDIRSLGDQNTRVVGDFTKMVRVQPVAKRMHEALSNTGSESENWRLHFEKQMHFYFPQLPLVLPSTFFASIVNACGRLEMDALNYRRQTLQSRFFETGDIIYLGMEFPREYMVWKAELGTELVQPLVDQDLRQDLDRSRQIEKLKVALMKQIDRLWYESCLEALRHGDVYNPGARGRVPNLYIIDSSIDVKLVSLPVGESFRCRVNENEKSREKFEVLVKKASGDIIARNVEGQLSIMKPSDRVCREANLTRGPNGNQESKVAIDTFDVAHVVAHRSMRLTDRYQGYVAVFAGDGQAAPHFMRYSGLVGAGINAMSFNNFLKDSFAATSFGGRYSTYLKETNWSNSEVVIRGTGSNFGIDGLLRPGFSSADLVAYLHSKVVETLQSGDSILSQEWMTMFAAGLVPRGMEEDVAFLAAVRAQFNVCVTESFLGAIQRDPHLAGHEIEEILRELYREGGAVRFWAEELPRFQCDKSTRLILDSHVRISNRVVGLSEEVIRHAKESFDRNERVSSELFLQPKPVDSVVDDFAVEAQNFANALTMSAALAAGALALTLVGSVDPAAPVEPETTAPGSDAWSVAQIFGFVLGLFNITVAFGTMTNVSRYKIRNEETRILIQKDSFVNLQKAVFSLMNRKTRDLVPRDQNPFFVALEKMVKEFRESLEYYDLPLPETFDRHYQRATGTNSINVDQIRAWRTLIAADFLPTVVNAYVQDALVAICMELDEMAFMLGRQHDVVDDGEAVQLFDRLVAFAPKLNASLQTGRIRFGFLKKRNFAHWDVMTTLRYIVSLFWFIDKRNAMRRAPIQSETLGILAQAKELAEHRGGLQREIQDLTTLYWATRESDVSSLIFVLAVIVFIASILFSIARIFDVATLLDVAFWAGLASATGALLAVHHLVRKVVILVRLYGQLARKPPSIDLTKVSRVTAIQIAFTVVRLATALLAAVAISWAVAENASDDIDTRAPEYIAIMALLLGGASAIIFLLVEFGVRYNLPVTLGPFVCGIFRKEIEECHLAVSEGQSRPRDPRTCYKMLEIETWEYTARVFLHEYRFDTVFAADRFGSILQYIQSGMEDASQNDEYI